MKSRLTSNVQRETFHRCSRQWFSHYKSKSLLFLDFGRFTWLLLFLRFRSLRFRFFFYFLFHFWFCFRLITVSLWPFRIAVEERMDVGRGASVSSASAGTYRDWKSNRGKIWCSTPKGQTVRGVAYWAGVEVHISPGGGACGTSFMPTEQIKTFTDC